MDKRVLYPSYRSEREVKSVTDTKPGVKGLFSKITEKHAPPYLPVGEGGSYLTETPISRSVICCILVCIAETILCSQ